MFVFLVLLMDRQFLSIPPSGVTSERVFSFTGLTLSDLCKTADHSWIFSNVIQGVNVQTGRLTNT
jgi:hypothetical protein